MPSNARGEAVFQHMHGRRARGARRWLSCAFWPAATLVLALTTATAPQPASAQFLSQLFAPKTQNAPTPPQPLTAIDWLAEQAPALSPAVVPPFSPDEPDITPNGTVPDITVAPLAETADRRIGLVPAAVTGLPDTLWQGSSGTDLARALQSIQIAEMGGQTVPALQALMYTLLLTEALPPSDNAARFDQARVRTLMAHGALDPALALLEQIGAQRSPQIFAQYFEARLLDGSEDMACPRLLSRQSDAPSVAALVFCQARSGDWQMAALTLTAAHGLGSIPPEAAEMMARFLEPDLFDALGDPVPPAAPDPLAFRVYEAIGTRIPTTQLPLVYANRDLRGTAGWRAQLMAVERLAATGAVPDNAVLGIYTARAPAASGGIWDRVRTVQRFETALASKNTDAVAKTLPTAWAAMRDVGLEVPFARLFAADLPRLEGPAARAAAQVLLLSARYAEAAQIYPQAVPPAWAAVAAGDTRALAEDGPARGPMAQAIIDAFAVTPPNVQNAQAMRTASLGAALLEAVARTSEGAKGDPLALRSGLARLRALGQEDTSRRVALQLLLRMTP